jgi:acetate kinase
MRIATVNAGSTSVRLAAFAAANGHLRLLAREHQRTAVKDRRALLNAFFSTPEGPPLIAVVHRIVHGGEHLVTPMPLDAHVEDQIAALGAFAPLHNPAALQWIAAARAVCAPATLQVGAFDTAFFARLPRVARQYAVPAQITALGVRRYGFHGLAHEAMWRRWCALRPDLPDGGRVITLQLGGGSSVAAIARGRAIDTSMGFSPLEGLVMRTRSGDIDPAVVPFLEERLACSGERVLQILNQECGLVGLSGVADDMSALIASPLAEARFAVDLYCYRARKALAGFMAALGGCDGIVFGGGVGENVPQVRAQILDDLRWAGVIVDEELNRNARGVAARISGTDSVVSVHVVPVDEDEALARAAVEVIERGGGGRSDK